MKLIADLHAHTPNYETLKIAAGEMAKSAKNEGIKYLALTDHAPKTGNKYNSYLFDDEDIGEIDGVTILRGAEADIMNFEGELAFDKEVFDNCHIVLAALHTYKLEPKDKETHTVCLVSALANESVDILAHPGDAPFDFDEEAVVMAAKEYGKALEFNELSLRDEACHEKNARLLALCKKHGCLIAVSSDAQRPDMVGKCEKILKFVKNAGIEDKYIVNLTKENLYDFLKSRGKQQSLLKNIE